MKINNYAKKEDYVFDLIQKIGSLPEKEHQHQAYSGSVCSTVACFTIVVDTAFMTGTVTFLSPKIVGVIAVSVDVVSFGASGRVKIFYTTGISTARSLRSFRYCSVHSTIYFE